MSRAVQDLQGKIEGRRPGRDERTPFLRRFEATQRCLPQHSKREERRASRCRALLPAPTSMSVQRCGRSPAHEKVREYTASRLRRCRTRGSTLLAVGLHCQPPAQPSHAPLSKQHVKFLPFGRCDRRYLCSLSALAWHDLISKFESDFTCQNTHRSSHLSPEGWQDSDRAMSH